MRKIQHTVTPADIQARANHLIQQHVQLPDSGRKCQATVIWGVLLWAASCMRSLAAACATLLDAPSDTAVANALLAGLPAFAELQRRLNRALQGDLPKSLRRRRQPIAIDLTLLPYHGEPQEDEEEVYRSQAKSGTTHFHAYATAYVICKGQRYTVGLVAVAKSERLSEVIKQLLQQAARAGVRPRYLLLDRGFCSVEVIRYLQAARYSWLMPLTLRGRKLDHPKGPSGSRVFAIRKKSCWEQYTMTSADGKRASFPVCIKCRNRSGERGRHGREALVYACSRLPSTSYEWVRQTYRSRFGIETSYRQMHQARIRTSTRSPLLRLLYVGVALILRNIWVWVHYEVLAQRRRGHRLVNLSQMTLRHMLLWLQHAIEHWLKVDEILYTERPIPC